MRERMRPPIPSAAGEPEATPEGDDARGPRAQRVLERARAAIAALHSLDRQQFLDQRRQSVGQ